MTNDIDDHGGEPDEIARFLRERVARHQAPTRLRAAVVETLSPSEGRRRPSLWLPPALSALATAMVMLLWLAPVLWLRPGIGWSGRALSCHGFLPRMQRPPVSRTSY